VRPFIAAVLLSLASCGENVLGPLDDTVFVLQSIDGVPLPATVAPESGGLAWIVTADTIWLGSGSRWRRHNVQHREEGVGGEPFDAETDGSVRRQGGVLVLAFNCRGGDCIAPDRLVENATVLEMDNTYLHAGRKLVFMSTEFPNHSQGPRRAEKQLHSN
jgi:hypothetical protein